jgi:hypothetical protein
MPKRKHWEVMTAFRMHGEDGEEAQRLVESLVNGLLDSSGERAGPVVITVHRAKRLQGPADNCPVCKAS